MPFLYYLDNLRTYLINSLYGSLIIGEIGSD